MSREEKLQVLKDVEEGKPLDMALHRNKYRILYKREGYYENIEGERITEEERLKYLSDSIIVEPAFKGSTENREEFFNNLIKGSIYISSRGGGSTCRYITDKGRVSYTEDYRDKPSITKPYRCFRYGVNRHRNKTPSRSPEGR